MSPELETLTIGDSPESWAAAGFCVEDGRCRIGVLVLDLPGRDRGRGIRSWGFGHLPHSLKGQDIDGLPTDSPPSGPAPATVHHPNGVTGVDHLVVSSPDCDRTVAALETAGFEARGSRLTENHGMPMRQVFFWAGAVILELIGPAEPAGDGPATFFGLALVADDHDATTRWFGDRIGRTKEAVQSGRRIATVRHKEFGISVPIAVMSPHESDEGSSPPATG